MRLVLLPAVLLLFLAGNLAAAEDYYDDSFYDPPGDQPQSDEDTGTKGVKDLGQPMLGIQMTPPPRRVQQRENLDPDQGVYVHRVYNDTAADDLGIRPGDVITEINGRPIGSMRDLRDAVFSSEVGQEAQVVVRRGGGDLNLGGAAFKKWPDDIPVVRIDDDAEERYRRRQMGRLARDMNRLDQLDDQAQELQQELQQGADKLAAYDRAADRTELARAATGADEPILPQRLLALPAWGFEYRIDVASPDHPDDLRRIEPSPLAAVAPPIDLDVRVVTSSEAL